MSLFNSKYYDLELSKSFIDQEVKRTQGKESFKEKAGIRVKNFSNGAAVKIVLK